MQRVVSEAVQLVQFPLVHGVVPVDLEELFRHGSDAVHVVGVESDDTRTNKVRDVAQHRVFVSFQFQLARQTLFRFHASLYRRHNQSVAVERVAQSLKCRVFETFQLRNGRAVLLQDHFAMQIHKI